MVSSSFVSTSDALLDLVPGSEPPVGFEERVIHRLVGAQRCTTVEGGSSPQGAPAQPLPRAARNGWYVDQAYSILLVNPGAAAARFTANVFDTKVVDGLVNGVGAGTRRLAGAVRVVQTGFVRSYALAFFLGAVGVLVWLGTRL